MPILGNKPDSLSTALTHKRGIHPSVHQTLSLSLFILAARLADRLAGGQQATAICVGGVCPRRAAAASPSSTSNRRSLAGSEKTTTTATTVALLGRPDQRHVRE